MASDKKCHTAILIFLFACTSLFAQQYRIAAVNYDIDGITKQSALERNIKIQEGKTFPDRESLDAYIVEIKQELINARFFETVQVEYTIAETDAGTETPIPVTINISTVDSGHFVILPYPKYDSNKGFELKLKIKENNFLGTMSGLSSDLFFLLEQKQKTDYVLGGNIKCDLPFMLGKVESTWNNDLTLQYAFKRGEFEWDAKTGFTFLLPFEKIALRMDLTQGATRNPEYKKFGDDIYFTEDAKFSVPIVLQTVKGICDIVYTPAVEFIYNWDKDKINALNEDLVSPELTLSHGISTGRVNWHGNFRKGFSASLEQCVAYNFQLNEFQPGVSAQVQGFYAWDKIGINSRIMYFSQFNSYKRYGQFLRGAPDAQYFAESTGLGDVYACKSTNALILNIDAPIHLFTTDWEKIGWNKFKSFNFELQISPFIDVALAQNRITGRILDPRDGFYTCGIELLLFPEKWHSIQIRASAGFDIGRLLFKNAIDTSWRSEEASKKEISVGFGLFY